MISIGKNARFTKLLAGAAILAGTAAIPTAPALANASADYYQGRLTKSDLPQILSADEREYYRSLFQAIRAENWSKVAKLFDERKSGPLHAMARAEYYLAANSPRAELSSLTSLLNDAPDLPQGQQLARLAERRGATALPYLPQARRLSSYAGAPRRGKPRAIDDGTMPSGTASAIQARIKDDDPQGAHQLLIGVLPNLSSSARAEWQQRVAWSFYIENDDANARDVAMLGTTGTGSWVAESWWIAGLANWRMQDCGQAAQAFETAAGMADNAELAAAGYYWASRARLKCGDPQAVQPLLLRAAGNDETLYGMLARETLAMKLDGQDRPADFSKDDWARLQDSNNVRSAIALSEIGETGLADEALRFQAQIGRDDQHDALARLTRDLSLPSAQLWMAHNGPAGGAPDSFARYPSPKWQPLQGWRVDPALVYAHSLQESNFRASVVSHAGARGLMQIMPGTARHLAARRGGLGGNEGRLNEPVVNLEFGQSYLEMLRDMGETGGLLPKVMAAYNAGPAPIGRWNSEVRDNGDPLLYMESIPYWETRQYVAIVMRNYWMYERQAGARSSSRQALTQGLWPRFPGSGGAEFVDMSGGRRVALGN